MNHERRPVEHKEIGIVTGRMPQLPVFKTLVALGGAVFLFQMGSISQQARTWNHCVDNRFQQLKHRREAKSPAELMKQSVNFCNGGAEESTKVDSTEAHQGMTSTDR